VKRLCYKTLDECGYKGYILKDAPERILQFGEGNFLRAFVDHFIDVLNEKTGFNGKIVVSQMTQRGRSAELNAQEGLYTLCLRGLRDGAPLSEKRVISAISRAIDPYKDYAALIGCAKNPDLKYIVSNTTEAGIRFDAADRFDDAPPAAFPARLTRLLFERWRAFAGAAGSGFVILACELNDNNGRLLRECVEKYIDLWGLPGEFARWVREENRFLSTLVDRIVTGYPAKEADALAAELGYEDKLLDAGEIFALWIIEGEPSLFADLRFREAGLPVETVKDLGPYKTRKVRVINGAHTSTVLGAYLAGENIVRECMGDPVIGPFMRGAVFEEIIPTLDMAESELVPFAEAALERFSNPFIDHRLLDISLNSVSKWRSRILPSLKGYAEKFGRLPERLTFSLAALLRFYTVRAGTSDAPVGIRAEGEYPIRDEAAVLAFCRSIAALPNGEYTRAFLGNVDFWGEDLNGIDGLADKVAALLGEMDEKGARAVMERLKG